MPDSIGPLPLNRIPWSRPSWLRPKYLLFAAIGLMFLLVAVVFERFVIDYRDPEWKHIESFKMVAAGARNCRRTRADPRTHAVL